MIVNRRYKRSKLKRILFLAFISAASITFCFFINQSSAIIPITTATNLTKTRLNTTIVIPTGDINCLPYTVPDNRSFFEREPPQLNLPRRISYSSDQDLFRYLLSLRLNVLATARNVEANIDNFRKHIEPIVDLFHPSSRILICESDSTDKTVEKLYEWPRAQVYRYGNISKSYPDRSNRIAFCRNKLLNITHRIITDYILVVDLDIFVTSISTFISNFRYDTGDWSVMTATTRGSYYDIWALRTLSDSILNFDVWHRIWDIQRNNNKYCSKSVTDQIIGIHQKAIPIEHDLIEVRSAFNGAGLYKTNVTYGCKYSGANSTCEHVPFHLCIREKNQARIFINPAFVIG